MKIAILGAGALGCAIGAALTEGDNEVWLLNRSVAHVEAMRRDGPRVDDAKGSRHVMVRATTRAAEVGAVDLVVVLVKSFHTDAAMRGALELIGPETRVLSLQNGLGHEDVLADIVGRKRVLVLGAGGAVRGALLPFIAARPAELVIANRTISRAQTLVAQVVANGPLVACGYGDLQALGRFDLVVNATSASLTGALPLVPSNVFSTTGTAYELAYGKGLTPFLQLARNAGVLGVADGVGMLVEQAAEAFVWWRGVRPQTRAVIDRLTVPLD